MFPSFNSSSPVPVPNPVGQRPGRTTTASSTANSTGRADRLQTFTAAPTLENYQQLALFDSELRDRCRNRQFVSALKLTYIFGIIAIIAGSITLFLISPADRTYVGLWRTGGAALFFGGILCFWDLYHLLTWQHGLAIVVSVIFAMWIIGAGSD
jgi:hypothetical protein